MVPCPGDGPDPGGPQARLRQPRRRPAIRRPQPSRARPGPHRERFRQGSGAPGQRHFPPQPAAPHHPRLCRRHRGQSQGGQGPGRGAAQDAPLHGRRHSGGAAAPGFPHPDPALLRRPSRGTARPRRPGDPGSVRAPGQPPGGVGAEVGAGGPVVPLPSPRHLQEDRQDARREARRAGAVHRRRHRAGEAGSGGGGRPGRGLWPAQAHLFHLEQDAQEGPGVFRGLRHPRPARDRQRGQGLLHGAGHRAQHLDADPQGIRRLHFQPQGQLLPLAAHRGALPRRAQPGSADPHLGDAPPRRAGHCRPLALQGRQQAQRRGLRRQDRLAAPAAHLEGGSHRFLRLGQALQAGRPGRHAVRDGPPRARW